MTDAGLLSAVSDGTLLVFAVGRTHKEQARLCAKIMGQVGGRVLGVVLNLAPRKGVGQVVYGAGHGYSSYGYEAYTSTEAPVDADGAADLVTGDVPLVGAQVGVGAGARPRVATDRKAPSRQKARR